MYRYVGCEYLFRDEEGRLLSLEFESPVDYETRKEAEEDETTLKFTRKDGEIKLLVYSKEWQLLRKNEKGIWVLRSLPAGELIAELSYSDFKDNLRNKIKRYIPPCEGGKEEFETIDDSFDELFPDMREGKTIHISSCESGYVTEGGNYGSDRQHPTSR